MLNQAQKKEYILSHKKQIQKLNDINTKEMNDFFKDMDKRINEIESALYKYNKQNNPKKTLKKPSTFKTKPLKYEKIKDSYLKDLYTVKHNNHKEKLGSINLTPYLNKIRNKKKEHQIVLLIKNNKIIKEYILTSDKYTYVCSPSNMAKIKQEAIKLKADLYMVHNHPVLIVANPSVQDVKSYYIQKKDYKKEGIKLLDFGIVTFDDYFSCEQNAKIANKAIKQAKEHGITNKVVLELLEAAFLTKRIRTFTAKKSSHPNIKKISKKKDEIKALSTKKYKKLQKQARKEFDRFIKLHPEYSFHV